METKNRKRPRKQITLSTNTLETVQQVADLHYGGNFSRAMEHLAMLGMDKKNEIAQDERLAFFIRREVMRAVDSHIRLLYNAGRLAGENAVKLDNILVVQMRLMELFLRWDERLDPNTFEVDIQPQEGEIGDIQDRIFGDWHDDNFAAAVEQLKGVGETDDADLLRYGFQKWADQGVSDSAFYSEIREQNPGIADMINALFLRNLKRFEKLTIHAAATSSLCEKKTDDLMMLMLRQFEIMLFMVDDLSPETFADRVKKSTDDEIEYLIKRIVAIWDNQAQGAGVLDVKGQIRGWLIALGIED